MVKWQTRKFEGLVPKGVEVQILSAAPLYGKRDQGQDGKERAVILWEDYIWLLSKINNGESK